MKGVIAAGRGSESDPQIRGYAGGRHLLPVGNRALLFHALDGFRRAGIEEAVVVITEETEEVRWAVGDGRRLGIEARYVECVPPLTPAAAVAAAAPFLGSSPFVVQGGESLLTLPLMPLIELLVRDRLDAVVLLQHSRHPERHELADLEDGRLVSLGPGPREPATDLALVDVTLGGPALLEATESLAPSWRGQLEMFDALERLLENGRVAHRIVDRWWKFDGDVAELLEGNRLVLDQLPAGPPQDRGSSRISGRVRIDSAAVVESSVVRGPAVIGAGATVSDAYVGPYTAIGEGACVENAEVEDSVLLAGARIENIRGRLQASVVGRGAHLRREFELPTALRFLVCDDSEVILA